MSSILDGSSRDDFSEESIDSELLRQRVIGGLFDRLPIVARNRVLIVLSKAFTKAGLRQEAEASNSFIRGGPRESGGYMRATAADEVDVPTAAKLREYLQSGVLNKDEIRTRVSTRLCDGGRGRVLLQACLDESAPVQIAFLNELTELATPAGFAVLCKFLESSGVWAVNLGEIEFSREQCSMLARAMEFGGIGFAFVEGGLVGADAVSEIKQALRRVRLQRRANGTEPWLLQADSTQPTVAEQNAIIKQCRKMWWNAHSLRRNMLQLSSRELAEVAHEARQEHAMPDVATSAPAVPLCPAPMAPSCTAPVAPPALSGDDETMCLQGCDETSCSDEDDDMPLIQRIARLRAAADASSTAVAASDAATSSDASCTTTAPSCTAPSSAAIASPAIVEVPEPAGRRPPVAKRVLSGAWCSANQPEALRVAREPSESLAEGGPLGASAAAPSLSLVRQISRDMAAATIGPL